MRSTGGFTMDSLQLRAANAGQGHGDETHRFRARGEESSSSTCMGPVADVLTESPSPSALILYIGVYGVLK